MAIPKVLFAIFLCMRPKQWTKNFLLFAGIVFTSQIAAPELVCRAAVGFFFFCLLSGVVYIINDIKDAKQDRLHPRKCRRPIASGKLGPVAGGVAAALLTIVALVGSYKLGIGFGVVATIYLVLNLFYSLSFKNIVILDIFCISLGFVLRAYAGIEVISLPENDIEITPWFLLCAFFLALFLAICKRRNEMLLMDDKKSEHRKVLSEYSEPFLDQLVAISTTSSIMSYALWTVMGKFEAQHMVYTTPFVVFGIFRYLYLVYQRHKGGEPETLLLTDVPLLGCIVMWLVTVLALLSRIPPVING